MSNVTEDEGLLTRLIINKCHEYNNEYRRSHRLRELSHYIFNKSFKPETAKEYMDQDNIQVTAAERELIEKWNNIQNTQRSVM